MTCEYQKTGKFGTWCVCALYIILKMNCVLDPHDANYEIIKFTTELPQSY